MLSVIIITKNEADNIGRCLESVRFADEIVVVDSGSTDKTVEIAKQYTDKVFVMDWQGYGVQKQRALDKANGDWVLNLDADEAVSEALKVEIQRVIRENQIDALRIPIQMNFYGKSLRNSSSPTRHIRLFKREGAMYDPLIVHEKILLPKSARVAQSHAPIHHVSFRDLSHALTKINRYSSYSAHLRADKKSVLSAFAASLWMFLRCYILQRGFLDGRAGFLMAMLNAQGSFFRGMKQIYRDQTSVL